MMSNCDIHGKYKGKTCGYCGLGNRIKDLTVHQENQELKQRIKELEATIQRLRDVRNDLATQTLNSHAVKMLDKPLEQSE